MQTDPEAQIYLADQRGCTQSAHFQSLHTFSFGDYQPESRAPFGNLKAFNEDTLLAGKQQIMQVDQPTEIFILPIAGGLEVSVDQEEACYAGAGEALHFLAFPDKVYKLTNPFDSESINFLQIWFSPTEPPEEVAKVENLCALTKFNLENRNTLLPLLGAQNNQNRTFIGMYGGRQEGVYEVQENQVFIFVIQGAFEVQNRLLHPRDGLMLQNPKEVEFEALSNDAILLVLDVQASQ
jgi:quercetin 2,3-dioxygenase